MHFCQNFRSVDFRNFCTPVHFPRAPEQKLDSEAFFSHTSQALTLRFNVCTWDVWCKPSSNSNRKVIFLSFKETICEDQRTHSIIFRCLFRMHLNSQYIQRRFNIYLNVGVHGYNVSLLVC